MRVALFGLFLIVISCESTQPRKPLVDGQRQNVSVADLQALDAAARHYIASYPGPKAPIYRFHVISRDKVEIYYGQHIGAGPVGDPQWLEAERVGETWRIANAIYPAQTTSGR